MNQSRINQVGKFAEELAKESTDNMELQLVVMSIVFKAVEWADSHPAWVSVEEMLPEENTAPIVRMDLTENFGEETILYDVVAFDGNGFHTPYRVTHWKQIVPPAEKGGEQ